MRRQALIIGLALLLPAPAKAACKAADACYCTVAATGVSFGAYSKTTTARSAGDIQVRCGANGSVNIAYEIRLSSGGGGSFGNRRMTNGGDNLLYDLYRNSGRTQVWGDGTAGTSTMSGVAHVRSGAEDTATHVVYGQIPANQTVTAGSYLDSIVVTVVY